MMQGPYAIGFDIGGTFTDLVLLDGAGATRVHKLLSTPDDPSRAALEGVRQLLDINDLSVADVDLLVHSTTLVTNALTEQRGAKTGLITTKGFRDLLEMRTEHRYDIYDLFLEWPDVLVPRQRRLTVDERVLADGRVLAEADSTEIKSVVGELLEEGVGAIAVCFLHSYKNPVNEQRVAEVISAMGADLAVSISSDVAPVIREYERVSTTVADAYVKPTTDAYLTKLTRGLEDFGFRGNLFLMLSGGGSATIESARRSPIHLVESGPAAGAEAAGLYGELTGIDPLISFDMGGTTAKLCLVKEGQPEVVNVLEVARTRRFMRGSGMPVVTPSVELIEIGAGGGSVARLDALGLLKVGPDSAGASPGPICYGQGGDRPTVTDANLVLGYLDPGYFLGGRLALDVDAATDGLAALGEQAGMAPMATAWGIHSVVNENMAQAARMHLQERNVDPRRVGMVAFGGAGPAHAAGIAKLLGIDRIVYPLGAGATSALGSLVAPLSFRYTQSMVDLVERVDATEVDDLFAGMTERGYAELAEAGVTADAVTITRQADLRVYGQAHELTVDVPDGDMGDRMVATLLEEFEEGYRAIYGRFESSFVVEVVNWKLIARGPSRQVHLRFEAPPDGGPAIKTRRSMYVPEEGGPVEVPVYDRYHLVPGDEIEGPAIVEERETTVIVPADADGHLDEYGDLVVDLGSDPAGRTP